MEPARGSPEVVVGPPEKTRFFFPRMSGFRKRVEKSSELDHLVVTTGGILTSMQITKSWLSLLDGILTTRSLGSGGILTNRLLGCPFRVVFAKRRSSAAPWSRPTWDV